MNERLRYEPPSVLTIQQAIAALFVLFLIPLLILNPFLNVFSMLFDALGLGFLWNKSSQGSQGHDRSKDKRKKLVRTRADQLADSAPQLNGKRESLHDGYYPGLVNISGTYCFLNSTLQALASLTYLQPYLETLHERAVDLDVPTPVVDALLEQLIALNTPGKSQKSLRPEAIIKALSTPTPGFKRSTLFSSRQHQDAQELFQLVTEVVKEEALAIEKEANRDRGLGGFIDQGSKESLENSLYLSASGRESGKGVFEGLTANRRSCVQCGYTEAVMHFSFDNIQLTVPTVGSCRLEDCFAEFIKMEILNDCICRKCSMLATHAKLKADVDRMTAPSDTPETTSKKKRVREAKKMEAKVKSAIEEGRIEDDIKGVTIEKVISKLSTKQAMIARPPPVLALHLNRSSFYGQYASKNNCRVIFPEILDLTPYTTSGALSIIPNVPISTPIAPSLPFRNNTPTPSIYSVPRVLYRLTAVVCHYGAHSYGHYVAFRRMPRSPAAGASRWTAPTMRCPFGCECTQCKTLGPVRDEGDTPRKNRGWLHISDSNVHEVGLERVLQETSGTFMLYYERIVSYRDAIRDSARSSEETVTPATDLAQSQDLSRSGRFLRPEARIVRSTSVGVGKGKSREPSSDPTTNGTPITSNGTPVLNGTHLEKQPSGASGEYVVVGIENS